jgi:hypothetical protein
MNNTQLPLTRDLVLIGGGHTHALVLRKWGMNPLLACCRDSLLGITPAMNWTLIWSSFADLQGRA